MAKTYYLSTDMETLGYNGPIELPDGSIVQGCNYYPIIQIAGKLLDHKLNECLSFNYYIQPTAEQMARASEAAVQFHIDNGFDVVWENAERISIEEAEERILIALENYFTIHTPEALDDEFFAIRNYEYSNPVAIIIHGKSVNFDRTFMNCWMPRLAMKISHQTADVSSIRTLMYPVKHLPNRLSCTASTHDALDDVDAAIADHKAILDFLNLVPQPGGQYLFLEDYTKAVLVHNETYIAKVKSFIKTRLFK